MTQRSILVVVPRVPWPPRRSGFSVRYYPLLRHLCANHAVDMVVLGDREAWGEPAPFPGLRDITYVDVGGRSPSFISRVGVVVRGLMPGAAPFETRSVWTGEVLRSLRAASRKCHYDVMLWTGPEYLEAALLFAQSRPARRSVYDLVDSPSMIATRARREQDEGDVRALRAWENRLRDAIDLTIYISEADARASQPADPARDTLVLANGIYLDDLPAGQSLPRPAGLAERYVLFFGHMSFGPNVDAAGWLAKDIMPSLRARDAGLQLVIAGHQPAPEVQALASAHTIVTGSVESIWPYVRNAAACVFPLRLASGLQNKVLEALAMGKPVVTTRQCAAAVGAEHGVHLLAADTLEESIAASTRLLEDPDFASRLGAAGRELVLERFDWSALTQRFERALLGD